MRRLEVLALAFVLPGEEALLPHVREAVAAIELLGALLEGVPGAGRIGISRGRFAKHPAEVAEVGRRRRPLAGRHAAPLRGELGRVHACADRSMVTRSSIPVWLAFGQLKTMRTSCARVGRTRSHGHPARATCRSSRSAYLVATSGLTRWTAQPGQPGRANQLSRHGQRLRSGARLWGRAALPRLDAEPEQPILGLDE